MRDDPTYDLCGGWFLPNDTVSNYAHLLDSLINRR